MPERDGVDAVPNQKLELLLAMRQQTAELELLLDRELAQWHGISADDFRLMLFVHSVPTHEMTRNALAAQLGIRLTDLVKRIRPLQRIGLIAEPSESGGDLRTTSVALTDRGIELLADASRTANDVADGALAARWDQGSLELLRVAFGVAEQEG
jgi:DNA-binding MarR family transcriptional regulator